MLSHATARDWLIPYADGMLAAEERKRVDGHLVGCAACAAELREVRELNLLLVSLPPAPPVAFAPFWLKLQAVLPVRRATRLPKLTRYRRLAVAFALAALLLIGIGATALAAPAAMPDNVLYPAKQLEEGIQLAITPSSSRLAVELNQADERLQEAQVMAGRHKPLLAIASLKAFRVRLNDAAASLAGSNPQRAQQEVARLRVDLDAVERENAEADDDDSVVRQLVGDSSADLDRIDPPDPLVTPTTVVVGSEATPEPAPQPKPVAKPTPTGDGRDEEHH